MLSINNLTKKFGKFIALDNVSLDIEKGNSVALLGPNGSGKTTLIKSVLGLVSPSKGDVLYEGKKTKANDLKELIGYMPQIGRYPENMKVDALINMMLSLRGKSIEDCDRELYDQFDIGKIGKKNLGELSGGTKQKVGAVLAFLFKPKILILDEPTAGLDPVSSSILKEKISSFKGEDNIVIITSHIISELEPLVSKVIYLIDGKLYFYKPVHTIKEETKENILEKALASLLVFNHSIV
ncbi:MAG: ABC transporter ATP-binding protein [Bacteroidia bacterium]